MTMDSGQWYQAFLPIFLKIIPLTMDCSRSLSLKNFLRISLTLFIRKPESLIRIDLEKQLLMVLPTGESQAFEINPYKKECMLKGLDDIDYLLGIKDLIASFETKNQ